MAPQNHREGKNEVPRELKKRCQYIVAGKEVNERRAVRKRWPVRWAVRIWARKEETGCSEKNLGLVVSASSVPLCPPFSRAMPLAPALLKPHTFLGGPINTQGFNAPV